LVSCVEFSFDLNVPLGGAPSGAGRVDSEPDVLVGAVVVGVVVVAAPLEATPNSVAPAAPPPSREPAIAAVMTPLRIGCMITLFHLAGGILGIEAFQQDGPAR
jgi:hypothetical protein